LLPCSSHGIRRFAYTPLLPAMQQAVGFDDRAAGALASANYAGYLLGALLLTIVPDRERTRPVLACRGAALQLDRHIATTAAMAATQSLAAWGALRFLFGLASAGVFVLATAIVHAILSRRGRLDRIGIHFRASGSGIRCPASSSPRRAISAGGGVALLAALSLVIMVPAGLGLREPAAPASARTSRCARRADPLAGRGAGHRLFLRRRRVHCHRHIPRRLRALDADPRALGGASMAPWSGWRRTGRRAVGAAGSAWAACRR